MNPIYLIRRIKLIFLTNQLIAFLIILVAVCFEWYSDEQFVIKLYQITSFSLSLLVTYVVFAMKYKDKDISKIRDRVNKMYSRLGVELSVTLCILFDLCLVLELLGLLSPTKAQIALYLHGMVVEPILFGFIIPDLFDYAGAILNKSRFR